MAEKEMIQQNFCKNLLTKSGELRQTSFLTDVKLICEGREFQVHKLILSAASPAFKEHLQGNPDTTTINIHCMNCKTLEYVLTFFYSGSIELPKEPKTVLKDLAEVSKQLQVPLLYNYCLELLLSCDSPEHLLPKWKVINELNSDVIKEAYLERIQENLKILQPTKNFLKLNIEQLKTILMSNPAKPLNQEVMLSSIVSWMKFDQRRRLSKLTGLLEKVDFDKVSQSYLRSLMEESVLKDNLHFHKECSRLLLKELQSNSSISGFSSTLNINDLNVRSKNGICSKKKTPSAKRKKSQEETDLEIGSGSSQTPKIVAIKLKIGHGKQILCFDRNRKEIFEFDSVRKNWTVIQNDILQDCFFKNRLSTVCSAENCIFFFGGRNSQNEPISKCYKLNLLDNKVSEISSMNEKRWNADAEKVHDSIYVIGGYTSTTQHGTIFETTMERYNLVTKSWEEVIKMPYPAKVIAVDNRLCLIGSCNLVWYSRYTKEWVKGEKLPTAFVHFSSIKVVQGGGKLFIFKKYERKIYCFDVNSKTWNIYPIPSDLNSVTDVINLPKEDTVEFLVVGCKKCFLYKPPSSWEYISNIPSAKPNLILTDQ